MKLTSAQLERICALDRAELAGAVGRPASSPLPSGEAKRCWS